MTKTQVVICPYCGATQSAAERCQGCGGLFEPLSRQATHNAMGPWFVRDAGKPFQPGCSYETIVRMIDRGQVSKYSIVRGPTSKQFWTIAKHVPGVAHLLGYCHNCDASVDPGDNGCHVCGVSFGAYLDRNYLGLPDVRPLPWEAEIDGPNPHRPADSFGRMSGATGISGFASDDELIDPGPAQVPSAVGRTDDEFSGESAGAVQGFDDQTSSATVRALRRTLEGRQRMVRVLAVLLAVVVILFVVTTVATTLQNSAGDAPVPANTVQKPESQQPQQPQQPVPHDRAVVAPVPESPVPEPQVHEPAVDPVTVAYTRAQQLIASAAREGRSLDERIGDLELALQELKDLDATAPAPKRPDDLAQMISQVEQDLERLRLYREFFGTPERS